MQYEKHFQLTIWHIENNFHLLKYVVYFFLLLVTVIIHSGKVSYVAYKNKVCIRRLGGVVNQESQQNKQSMIVFSFSCMYCFEVRIITVFYHFILMNSKL